MYVPSLGGKKERVAGEMAERPSRRRAAVAWWPSSANLVWLYRRSALALGAQSVEMQMSVCGVVRLGETRRDLIWRIYRDQEMDSRFGGCKDRY
jgi:hypothetical protein